MRDHYEMSYAVGRIAAGEVDQIWTPNNARGGDKYGAILLHGAGAPDQYANGTRIDSVALAAALATAGIPCIAGSMGGDGFANDSVMAKVTNAKTALVAATGCDPDKVHLIGGSMGAATGIRWASTFPDQVASFTGIIPLCNILNLYAGNVGGLAASVATAWGVVSPAALPSAANLATNAPNMVGIPSRLYYAGNDTMTPPADTLAMADLIDPQVVMNIGNLGHTDAAIAAVGALGEGNWSDLVDFLLANGA